MKNNLKRFLVVLCILTMALGLTACGKEKEVIEYDEAQLSPAIEMFVAQQLPMLTVEEVKANEAQMDEDLYATYLKGAESWEKASAEIGDIANIDSSALSSDEEKITAIVNITGTTGKTAEVEILLNKKMAPQSITVNVNRSFGELMTNAALNTLLGMGTVFVVLILIAFIIFLLQYISVVENMFKKKEPKETAAAAAADKAVAQIIETEELSDDLELVAVISAAIAAYEEAAGGSGDGYVVRSIKRRY